MSFKIHRPPTLIERKLMLHAEQYEKQAQVLFAENCHLRAKILNMIKGDGWRMKVARWLICADEARRPARAAASPEKSDNATGPARIP